MRLKTIGKIVGVGVVAVAVALVAVVYSIDEADVKRQIAQQVQAATGRALAIDGDVGVGLSLTPVLKAANVRFANAEWGSRPDMATIEELRVSAALLPLIGGKVEIRELDLVRPDILLETDAQGRGNWEFEKPAAQGGGSQGGATQGGATQGGATQGGATQGGSGGSAAAVDIRELAIEGGVLTYRDGSTGDEQRLELATLSFQPAGATANEIALDATYQGVPARLSGTVGGLTALTEGRAFPVDLSGTVAGIDLGVKGTAGTKANAPLNLSVTARSGDYRQLAMLTGPLPELGALDVQGQVSGTRQSFKLEPLTVRLGESDLAGVLSVDLTGPRPKLSGTLQSDRLDLAPLMAEEEAQSGGSGGGSGGGAAGPDGRVIPAEPFDLAALKAVDAALDYQATRVTLKQGEVTDLSTTLSLTNGDLRLEPLKLTSFGGALEQTIRLNASAQPAQLSMKGGVQQLDLGRLLTETGTTDQLTGKGDITLDLTGRGDNPRAIAGSLDGQVRAVMRDGVVHNKYLELLATDLAQQLLGGQGGDGQAKLNCFVTRFDIAKGVARSRVLLLDTSRMTLVGTGSADLGKEQLDMTLTPSPKDASLVSLATPILVRGSFANPSFRPDPAALATGLAGAIAGTAVNPLGLLVPFLSSGSTESPCAQAIAGLDNPERGGSDGGGASEQQKPGGIPGLFQNLLGR